MIRDGNFFLLVLGLGTILVQLLTPVGGFAFVVGDSMDPTIPAGCGVVAAQPWDGESSLEGEVVAFEAEHVRIDVAGSSALDAQPWVAHRVVAEYESYDPDDAEYYVTEDGFLVTETRDVHKMTYSTTDYDDAKALEGEHVFVFQGDNKPGVDPLLVHEDDVLGVIDEDAYLQLQDDGSWPCAAVA